MYDITIYDGYVYLGLSMAIEGMFCTADDKIINKLPKKLKKHGKNLSQIEEVFN